MIEFARLITTMWIFENPKSESGGKSASRICAKLFVCTPEMSPGITPSANPASIEGYQQVEHRVTRGCWMLKISRDGVNASEHAGASGKNTKSPYPESVLSAGFGDFVGAIIR